jgi:hypothetical protein
MLRLFTSIFKFLLFIAALVSGFMVALVVLPLPGKTFFNRMSQLPPSAKDLIDHSIGLGVAIGRLVFNLSRELNLQLRESISLTRSKVGLIKEKIAQLRKNLASRAREKVKL